MLCQIKYAQKIGRLCFFFLFAMLPCKGWGAYQIYHMTAGRPTKYKPEYCEQLIEFMSGCHTYEAFAGSIGVCIDTLYEWEKVHKEFSAAKKIAEAKSLLSLERMGLVIAASGKGNPTPWIFLMKNRFRKYGLYEDRQIVENNTTHSFDIDKTKLSPEKAKMLRNALADGTDDE